MEAILAWVFIIFISSALIAWAGVQILRWLSRVEAVGPNQSPADGDPSLLLWFGRGWRAIKSGQLRIRPGEDQAASPTSDNEQVTEYSAIPAGREAKPAGDTVILESTKLSAPQVLASDQATNIQLALNIPPGAKVRITLDHTTAGGSPVVEIDTDQGPLDTPVQVQILAPAVSAPAHQPIETVALPNVAPASAATKTSRTSWRDWKVVSALRSIPLGVTLFAFSLLAYLAIRLIGLERFPIYFFTDESVHTLLAEQLVKNRFHYNGVFFPTYFPMGSSYGLNSVSVYLQVIPYLLFGKSEFVTRAVSVLITLLGASAVSLILRDYFKSRYWWSGVLLLSIAPTWFLHSRTAFEYAELASFYAIFLYFYLGYRLRSPHFLYFAILAGGLVFYTHGLGQFLMAITAVLLIIVDIPYHWKQRKTFLIGLALILVLAIPYIRFARTDSSVFLEEMRTRGSYWLDQNLTLSAKLTHFGSEYLSGLNPKYWFLPDSPRDLVRHEMKGYGHLLLITLPFFLVGLWQAVKNIRSPAHRTTLIALLAAPFGAALAQVTVLRTLWLVIPATILIALGVGACLDWLEQRRLSFRLLTFGLFAVLLTINLYMLQDSLRNGPLWYRDYSLYGMQYGAEQLFGDAIPEILNQNPEARFVVTPTWANGTDNFANFFLTPEQQSRVRMDSIQAYLFERQPIDGNTWVVLTRPEFEEAVASPKFKEVAVQKIVNYPDGSPGFYFVKLTYSDQADAIFAAEKLARSQPVETQVQIGDQTVTMRYSQIDMGQPENIFDGDTYTLMRGLEANPFIIELEFPEPRPISKISADLANMDFTFTAQLFADPNLAPVVYETTQRGVAGDPHVDLDIDRGPDMVKKLRLEILSLNGGDQPHIHVRELKLTP